MRTAIATTRPSIVTHYLDYYLNPRALKTTKGYARPLDPGIARAELQRSGVAVEPYRIDPADFDRWRKRAAYPDSYYRGSPARTEKILEHYFSLQWLAPLSADSVLIDVACADSPFAAVVRREYGCVVYRQDLLYPEGIDLAEDGIQEIGGNAAFMPVPDSFASGMLLHCAFEMFQGENDSLLIQEAARVLRPGGRLVIVPLYLSDIYCILVDPLADRRGVPYDPGAHTVYYPNFHRIAFSRVYDVDAFVRRVVKHASGMSVKVIIVENCQEIDPSTYLHYAAIFEKAVDPIPH